MECIEIIIYRNCCIYAMRSFILQILVAVSATTAVAAAAFVANAAAAVVVATTNVLVQFGGKRIHAKSNMNVSV